MLGGSACSLVAGSSASALRAKIGVVSSVCGV